MTRLKVDGMTCNHCRAAVKDALESVAGVKAATVDLEGGFAEVEGSAGAEVLIAAVQEEGYQAAVKSD